MSRTTWMLLAGVALAGFTLPAATPVSTEAPTLTAVQDTAGKGIFVGKGVCHACHGPEGKGTPLAPDLTDKEWLHGDGSLAAITKTIKDGVAAPKKHPAPMPPMGGAQLTEAEILAVARYVFSLQPKG